MQPALFLPADLKVEAALKRMQRSGQWLAIVTSESQKEAGIVSLQDILKVVFSDTPKKVMEGFEEINWLWVAIKNHCGDFFGGPERFFSLLRSLRWSRYVQLNSNPSWLRDIAEQKSPNMSSIISMRF